jgi:biotin transport system substrate-specific component
VLGVATMYAGGVAQLMAVTGQGPGAALAMGVIPFIVGDATKIGLAFFGVRSARWALERRS